ncbi:MAG: S-adenosylmethionine:tRNA ribosyltransferase-isomerase [Bacteroidota bacterium]
MITSNSIISFQLPDQLACPLPTEKRGITRDAARLLVSSEDGQQLQHSTFTNLVDYLNPGDLLVVNTSATQAAALPIVLPNEQAARLHLSTQLGEGRWLVEIRLIQNNKTVRWKDGKARMTFILPEGAKLQLNKRYYNQQQQLDLWEAELYTSLPINEYLQRFAQPIKYTNVHQPYPLDYYQTFFAHTPGSSEMPSAGRGFAADLVQRLLLKGIGFAPILLHTGVSSLETGERPYPEYTKVSALSASIINAAKAKGGRIIAVGTTAIRALESATQQDGRVHAFNGHTNLFISHDYEMKIADGLITGFHEPEASHLHMLQALASEGHLAKAYQAALAEGYFWHEFGDFHLLLS